MGFLKIVMIINCDFSEEEGPTLEMEDSGDEKKSHILNWLQSDEKSSMSETCQTSVIKRK